MISDTYKITDADSRAHALAETERIGAFAGLTGDEAQRLRLVAEELLTLTDRLLDITDCAYRIETQGRGFSLFLSIRADVDDEARKRLVSVSSTGENAAARGLLGKLSNMLDAFLNSPDDASFLTLYSEGGSMAQMGMYSGAWSMVEVQQKEKLDKQGTWDGLEQSILARYADDVIVGVRSRSLEIVGKVDFT